MWAKEKKWVLIGIITLIINNISIFILSVLINLKLSLIFSAEISILVRYLLNEKYVFMSKLNTVRLIKFHYLNFSSFLVYILVVYILHDLFGFNLFIAVNLGTAISLLINYFGSFFLLWKK